MSAAAATQRAGPWARPVTRALLPQWIARLVGLAALGSVGALEWQRLVRDVSSGRALLWVAVAVAAAVAVLVVGRRARAVALPAIVIAGLFAGYALSGASLDLLKPRHWDELAAGLGTGLQALGTVRLPYAAADPWPRIVLELLGAELLILAGLLTFWPRVAPVDSGRAPLAVPERGYPFLALAVLIVVVASPVVSLGGTRPLLLGLTLAALSVCFLWLERLPLRPGLGVAALLGIALAGALPLAAVADRGEPWFDYRSFAESLGPDDPVRFSWRQSYGPIVWPREGNEVMRVTSGEPLYWKARNLEVFDGNAWTIRTTPPAGVPISEPWTADLPDDWRNRPAWTDTVQFSIRRVSTTDVVGAGTTVRVEDASRDVQPGLSPGTWDAPSGLRRGDSYTVQVHVPQPGQQQLSQAGTGVDDAQTDERLVTLPFVEGKEEHSPRGAFSQALPIPSAVMHFAPWRSSEASYAAYPSQGRSDFHVNRVMKRTAYARTWALAKRLKRGAENPMDYIRAVDAYLHRPDFRYTERPPATPPGREPLDFFLNDSHAGYCQHFAGAMALLLRMGGISARVATGFTPGGYSARHKAWIVRDTDAHAWVEAWFDRYGWVTLDPTPAATPARSQIASFAAPASSAAVTPDRDNASTTGGSSGDNPAGLRPSLLFDTDPAGSAAADEGGRTWLWAGGIVAVLLVALAVALFLRRPRGKTPMDRAIAELEAALRRVGRPVTTGTTLTQIEQRLGSYSPEVSAYLRALAAGRYALVPPAPPRTGRRALRRALAQGIGFGGRARALWAMPPRFERPPREPRSTTFEVETRVRA